MKLVVTGTRETTRRLQAIEAKLAAVAMRAVDAASSPLLADMRGNAPNTPGLRESLESKTVSYNRGLVVASVVGLAIQDQISYSHAYQIEFGHSPDNSIGKNQSVAHPFMRPALLKNKAFILRRMAAVLSALIVTKG